jgi:uncharacterized protein YueI
MVHGHSKKHSAARQPAGAIMATAKTLLTKNVEIPIKSKRADHLKCYSEAIKMLSAAWKLKSDEPFTFPQKNEPVRYKEYMDLAHKLKEQFKLEKEPKGKSPKQAIKRHSQKAVEKESDVLSDSFDTLAKPKRSRSLHRDRKRKLTP